MSKQTSKNKPLISFFYTQKCIYIVLFLILAIGFYLRIGGVLTNSFAFTYDVGRDLLEVQKIVVHHKIPLIGQTTGLGGLFYGPWWYYILTPAFILSRGNPQGIAFYMVLIGMATILLGYVFGKMISGRALGVTFAVIMAFSGAMIGFSSQIWNPNIAPFLVILVFICLFLLEKEKYNRFILSLVLGLLLGLILDSEIVFGALFATGIIFVLYYLLRKRLFTFSILGVPVGIIITLFPRIFFELRHNFVMTRSLFAVHSGDQKIFDVANFFSVFPGRLVSLAEIARDTLGSYYVPLTFAFIAACFFVFVVMRSRLREAEKKLAISSLIILGVFVIGSSFFARAVWGHYLVGLPVLYVFLSGLTVVLVSRKYMIFGIILLLIFSYVNIKPLKVLADLSTPLWEGNAAVYRNQLSAVDYVYKSANGKQFNYVAYTPVVHDYTYQYLFSWYGKNKYGYVPNINKESLFYLIIEPDPDNKDRIKDWLKVREQDGKVVREQAVKGGILVQSRIH